MPLESWMYLDPQEIGDALIKKSEAEAKKTARKKEVARKNKRRRIQKLVKDAMNKGGMNGKR